MSTPDETDRPITSEERTRLAGALAAIAALMVIAMTCTSAGCTDCAKARVRPHPVVAETSAASDPGPSDLFATQQKVVDQMFKWYPAGKVPVSWKPCGSLNSFFYPPTLFDGPHIELCTEITQDPGAAKFFAAHEAGHAITLALAGTTDEHAADEVGALSLIRMGDRDAVLTGGMHFAREDVKGHLLGDEHPSAGYRAWELMCLADGSEDKPASAQCGELYRSVKWQWDRRLSDEQVLPKMPDFFIIDDDDGDVKRP